MNIETTFRPGGVQTGCVGGGQAEAGAAAAAGRGRLPQAGATLTVRDAAEGPATGAAARLDKAGEADALRPDWLDALVKSALDFPPPPMPELK